MEMQNTWEVLKINSKTNLPYLKNLFYPLNFRIRYKTKLLLNRILFKQSVVFINTYRCNNYCRMCYRSSLLIRGKKEIKSNFNELNLNDAKEVIDKINKYYVRRPIFSFTGGESFLQENFIEILEYLSKQKNIIVLNTTLSDTSIECLRRIPKRSIFNVSLHGSQEVHDFLLIREGVFESVKSKLKLMKKLNFDIKLNCVISKYNVGKLIEFYEDIKELKIPINFQHLMWSDKKHSEMQKNISKELFNADKSIYINNYSILNILDVKILEKELDLIKEKSIRDNIKISESGLCGNDYYEHYCTYNLKQKGMKCTEEEIRIQPDGSVVSCMAGIYGNILKDNLKDILNNPYRKKLMSLIHTNFKNGLLFPLCVKCCKLDKN